MAQYVVCVLWVEQLRGQECLVSFSVVPRNIPQAPEVDLLPFSKIVNHTNRSLCSLWSEACRFYFSNATNSPIKT